MLLQIWRKVKLRSKVPECLRQCLRRVGVGGDIVVNCTQAVWSKIESTEGSQPRKEGTPESSAHWPKEMSSSDPVT